MSAADGTQHPVDDYAWERMWAPYDQPTYQAVLDLIHPDDTVLEIGAGDLRLARQIAGISRRVYAIEIQSGLLEEALRPPNPPLPNNLTVCAADARFHPFWPGITVAVLLMRHCLHFRLYAERLKTYGCRRLITNARWRLGVEQVFLDRPRLHFDQFELGWYACWCGSTGFKPGPVDRYSPEMDDRVFEVQYCPGCRGAAGSN